MSPRPDDAFGVQDALAAVAAGAAELDAHPQFPVAAFDALARRRAHRPERARSRRRAHRVPRGRVGRRAAVARADGSVGRIYDGHLNAVERLALAAPDPLRGESCPRWRPASGGSGCGGPTRRRAREPRRA